MAGTLAFDVKDALVNLLKTSPDFTTLAANDAIWYGYLGRTAETPRQVIWVGEIEWDDERAVAFGGLRRDEFFRILITIECHEPNNTQQEANNCVEGWMQKLEALIKNPRWSGLSIAESELKPQLLGEGQDDGGRGAILVLSLNVHARKTL